MDFSLPDCSVHGILQVRILERVAIPFSRGSSQLRDQTWVSCIADRFFINWAIKEAMRYTLLSTHSLSLASSIIPLTLWAIFAKFSSFLHHSPHSLSYLCKFPSADNRHAPSPIPISSKQGSFLPFLQWPIYTQRNDLNLCFSVDMKCDKEAEKEWNCKCKTKMAD